MQASRRFTDKKQWIFHKLLDGRAAGPGEGGRSAREGQEVYLESGRRVPSSTVQH